MLFDNMYEKIKVNYLEFTGNVEASVAELKNKASEFMALLEWFNEPEQQKTISENPELEAEYRILNTSAFNIQEKINSFTNAFDWVSGKIADTFNFTTNQQVMNGLNVIPFLPVAAIAGALTAITYWLTDAYKLKEKIEHVQKMEAKGYSPVRIAESLEAKALTDKLVPWVIGGGVVYLVVTLGRNWWGENVG